MDLLSDRISVALADEARKLTDHRAAPLELLSLLAELGVGLRFSSTPLGANHLGSLREYEGTWEVVIYRIRNLLHRRGLTPRERFTVAHELAHYIVESRFSYRPMSTADYWRLERVCNDFAATLLAPDATVEAVLPSAPTSATVMLSAIHNLSSRTETSFEVASRRIVEAMRCPPAAAACLRLSQASNHHPGTLSWLHENKRWMGGGRNRKVVAKHPFSPALGVAHSLLIGQVASIPIPYTSSACITRAGASIAFLVVTLA
jgi:hypothetical protein